MSELKTVAIFMIACIKDISFLHIPNQTNKGHAEQNKALKQSLAQLLACCAFVTETPSAQVIVDQKMSGDEARSALAAPGGAGGQALGVLEARNPEWQGHADGREQPGTSQPVGGASPGGGMAVGGGASPTGLMGPDTPLKDAAYAFKLPDPLLVALLEAVGAEPTDALGDLLAIPSTTMDKAILNMQVGGSEASPIQQGKIKRFLGDAHAALNLDDTRGVSSSDFAKLVADVRTAIGNSQDGPGSGSGGKDKPPEKQQVIVLDKDPSKRNFSDITDPLAKGTFSVIPAPAVNQLFKNFEVVEGGGPSDPETPTEDQAMAIYAITISYPDGQRVSWWVDFSLFGPWGRHTSEIRKALLVVWCPSEGGWRSKLMPGPKTYEEWKAAWAVFRSACIMAGAASSAALKYYADGINTAMADFGAHQGCWGTLMLADKAMRAERWEVLCRELYRADDPPASFDRKRPLIYLLYETAYHNNRGTYARWWYRNVDLPFVNKGGQAVL